VFSKKVRAKRKMFALHIAWARPVGYQVYSDFEAFLIPDKKCDFFIGDEDESKKE
jgi:hypothetical protein